MESKATRSVILYPERPKESALVSRTFKKLVGLQINKYTPHPDHAFKNLLHIRINIHGRSSTVGFELAWVCGCWCSGGRVGMSGAWLSTLVCRQPEALDEGSSLRVRDKL
ncbi:hypothetical protein Pmani_013833 [Petrolisthes manimaculis]|uniref:Uncharacterized protein n=1 Tax=Petrolisthes manimaculis TaxID=1843537 RepID=A0AAE1PVK8_9EUCA|nr:hypothetical protein Pmani_013833 [Petrolisthes manimaculis]